MKATEPVTMAIVRYALPCMLLLGWLSRSDARDVLTLYPAFGTTGSIVLEGRVVDEDAAAGPAVDDRRRDNLRRNLGLLVNEERDEHEVRITVADRQWTTVTDEEGYFHIESAIGDIGGLAPDAAGWQLVSGRSQIAADETGLLLIPAGNVHGLISDLDDTILITEVNSKRRMLANTLLNNPLQRQAVPGTARLYAALAARNADSASAPTFYLSASPHQLHRSIQAFLDHNGFPRGVLITKRVTNDATSEPIADQMAYKLAKIEAIFARVPHVDFTLIGDDGERDPEIYQQIRESHPDRVAAIWIRRVNPDPKRPRLPGQGDLADLLR